MRLVGWTETFPSSKNSSGGEDESCGSVMLQGTEKSSSRKTVTPTGRREVTQGQREGKSMGWEPHLTPQGWLAGAWQLETAVLWAPSAPRQPANHGAVRTEFGPFFVNFSSCLRKELPRIGLNVY